MKDDTGVFWTCFVVGVVAVIVATPPVLHYYARWVKWWLG